MAPFFLHLKERSVRNMRQQSKILSHNRIDVQKTVVIVRIRPACLCCVVAIRFRLADLNFLIKFLRYLKAKKIVITLLSIIVCVTRDVCDQKN